MTFHLTMLRPDKEFYEGEVECLSIVAIDGKKQVLANHLPMFMNLTSGLCSFTLADGTKKTFAMNDGMLSISHEEVVLQSDFLVWEDKLEEAVARRESFIEAEKKRRKESYLEYKQNKLEMAKTFVKLKGTQNKQIGEEL